MARVNAFQLITMKNSLSFFHLDSLLSSSHSRSPLYYYYYYYFTCLCAPFSPFILCYFLFFLLGIEKERENSIFILEHLEPGIGFSVNLSIMRHDGWIGNFRSIMRIPNIYIYIYIRINPLNVIENPARNDSQIPHQSSPINPHRLINPLTLPHPSNSLIERAQQPINHAQTRERDRRPSSLRFSPDIPPHSTAIPPYLFITRPSKRRRRAEKTKRRIVVASWR